MSRVLDQRSTETHHRLAITHLLQKRSFGVLQMQGCGSTARDVPTRMKPRLRAETVEVTGAGRREPQDVVRELTRMELILDAKRSQIKKMRQLSKLRFIGKFISKDYLDEVSADIA